MYYPVILAPQPEGGFTVTFPDIPEAISQGEDVEACCSTVPMLWNLLWISTLKMARRFRCLPRQSEARR